MATTSRWQAGRSEARGGGGMVAAKTPQAAEAGAEVLRQGGNAVDAAVVTAFVAGVVEPWMNGIGGGGFLVRHDTRSGESAVVEFPMVSPGGAREDMYPLSGKGPDAEMFGWASVVDNQNAIGPRSVAVPGDIAGLALALERFGSWSFAKALEPAIGFAADGFPMTWHTSQQVARDLANLNRYPATAAIFCDRNGYPAYTSDPASPATLRQADLARTLRTLADEGPRAFYEGEIAAKMVAHLREGGSPISLEDLSGYQARVADALVTDFHGYAVVTNDGPSGGVTLVESLKLIDRAGVTRGAMDDPEALHLMAQAFRIAFADRFAYLADPEQVEVPFAALLADGYLEERAAGLGRDRVGRTGAGARETLGVRHGLASSMQDYASGGSTTHLSVIDRDGVAVSLTQTLLDLWGSRVTIPGTGIVMNNGMMWFDPEPGRPNSIAGGKRPLSNMSPTVLVGPGGVAALGASGGRKIMNCVAQLVQDLADAGMGMQDAVGAPRIDASTATLLASAQFAPATIAELERRGHRVTVRDEISLTGGFASPACVLRRDGEYTGGVDPFYYPATAVGVD